MIDFIKWYLFFQAIGIITLPISHYLFKNLFDKGYSSSKILGILIWGYLYWIFNTFQLLNNTVESAVFVIIILMAISCVIIYKDSIQKIITSYYSNRKQILICELVFLIALLFMTFLRISNPAILGTEKPMELAFINGIMRTESYPPFDPWLSGYSISYYHLGYIIIAAISKLLNTNSGVGFNLALIFWFAMIASVSSGIVQNLLINVGIEKEKGKKRKAFLYSILAPIFILILGNAEGFLEVLHSKGIFWQKTTAGLIDSGFWRWLDLKELINQPSLPLDFNPNRPGAIWWWRASRVIQDYTVNMNAREIINEFPFFSFFLGDLHPHLIAIPFGLLCMMLCLEIFSRDENPMNIKNLQVGKHIIFLLFSALIIGSILFLNIWDFPIYFGLLSLVLLMKHVGEEGISAKSLISWVANVGVIGVACIFLFLPFLIGFASQAGGLLPSLIFRTRFIHFSIMFFPLIGIILPYLFIRMKNQFQMRQIIKISVLVFSVVILCLFISMVIPLLLNLFNNPMDFHVFLSIYEADSLQILIEEFAKRLVNNVPVLGTIIFLISAAIMIIVQTEKKSLGGRKNKKEIFIYLLLIISAGLMLFPEIFFLRDQFGWRMNTIFKFYFQSWIILAIVAAYAVSRLSVKKSLLGISATILSVSLGLYYPTYAIKETVDSFSFENATLDGNAYLKNFDPNTLQAVRFLSDVPFGFISEAVGGSYTNYGSISKLTGLPTVLGWPGHEIQWRGGVEEIGSREQDVRMLYETGDWIQAKNLMDYYEIKYIYIGNRERSTYQVNEQKFNNHLKILYENTDVMIYAR